MQTFFCKRCVVYFVISFQKLNYTSSAGEFFITLVPKCLYELWYWAFGCKVNRLQYQEVLFHRSLRRLIRQGDIAGHFADFYYRIYEVFSSPLVLSVLGSTEHLTQTKSF